MRNLCRSGPTPQPRHFAQASSAVHASSSEVRRCAAIQVTAGSVSLPLMDQALAGESMPYLGFLWKSLLVAITIGSGFYGGIVTPQFVIGAVTGSAFAHPFGVDAALGAAVGLSAVVAAASNTPIAAVLMGVELFGGSVGTLYIAGASVVAYLIIGHRSIYQEQRLAYAKSSWMRIRPETSIETEKARISYGLLKWWWSCHYKNQKPR